MKEFKSIEDIDAKPIGRFTSDIPAIDWLYGYTKYSDGDIVWGIPGNRISLFSGRSGIGKSRFATHLAVEFCNKGVKVLYFPTEMPLENFAGKIKNKLDNPNNFICSSETSLEGIVETIYAVSPSFVFIDSVNEIDEFKSGSKQDTRLLMSGDENSQGLRDVVSELACHIILIGQLNQDGTIKGGTSLPHLVDISLDIDAEKDKPYFVVKVGIKNRCGRSGEQFYSHWQHTDEGVSCVYSGEKYDEIWCSSHNLNVQKHPSKMNGYEQIDAGIITNPEIVRLANSMRKQNKPSIWKRLFS